MGTFGCKLRNSTSFSIFIFCKDSKNQEPKKQETNKMILWGLAENGNEQRSWKSHLHKKIPIWTMFYYFILIVQKLNFPPVPFSQGGKETNMTNLRL